MTLHEPCKGGKGVGQFRTVLVRSRRFSSAAESIPFAQYGMPPIVREGGTDDLPLAGAILDVEDEFLFLLFEFRPFAVEFALCLLKGALVLAESLCGRLCPAKERILRFCELRHARATGSAARGHRLEMA